MGLGIVIGATIGAITIHIGGSAVEPEHEWRSIVCGVGLRLVAFGESGVRPNSCAGIVGF